jgi:hypothetical protein
MTLTLLATDGSDHRSFDNKGVQKVAIGSRYPAATDDASEWFPAQGPGRSRGLEHRGIRCYAAHQNPQCGPGAVSSERNAAPTGAMITLMSTAG